MKNGEECKHGSRSLREVLILVSNIALFSICSKASKSPNNCEVYFSLKVLPAKRSTSNSPISVVFWVIWTSTNLMSTDRDNYDNYHKQKTAYNDYFYVLMEFRFPRKEKLKSKKLIEQLFAQGNSVSNYPIKLIYLKTELPFDVPIQAGVTVPKKNFKSAVKRNRIKRLMRESYRLNKGVIFNNSKGTFAFLFLYLGKEMPNYTLVEENLKAVLHKFKKKIDDE